MSALWSGISLREPLWLWLALQPLLILLLLRLLRTRRGDGYSDAPLHPWVISQAQTGRGWRYVRVLALWLAWCLFAIAIAGPRLPQSVAGDQQTAQRELIVLLDLSPSMAARDVVPNRLERAKLELLDLINRMQATRMGIVVYGAQPHLLSPMTTDKPVLRHYVATLHVNQLPSSGSRLGRALDFARTQFDAEGTTPRALLLLSDGEFHLDAKQQATLDERVRQFMQQGILFYALGIGSAYGAPVLTAGGWLEHAGQTVTSRLHADELQHLTQIGHGRYSELHDSNLDWQTLYDEGIARLKPVTQNQATEFIVWQELYHWFVLPAVLLLLLALWQPRRGPGTAMLSLLLLLSFNLFTPSESLAAAPDYQTAYQALVREDYPRARQQFARLAGFAARLGEGVAAYRMQDYKVAAQQFAQALLDADNDPQRGRALFNLGNSQYQVQDYQSAAQTYADVLAYLPDHKGARINRDYALALQSEKLTDDTMHRRAGSGAKTGRVQDGTDVGEGRLTLGEETDQPQSPINDTTISNKPGTTLLQQAHTASGKIDTQDDSAWDYRINSLEQLQQENPRIDSDPGQFWQRLYEWEEGYMAPQDQPQQLPGVQPW